MGFVMSTGATHRTRGWSRLWQTPVFVLGLLSLALAAATAPARLNPARDFLRDLNHLRATLADGLDLPDETSVIVPLLEKSGEYPRYEADCEFLVGSYYFTRAEADKANPDFATKASLHLSRAMNLTVRDGDLPTLLYRLGMIQYRQPNLRAQALNLIRQGLDLGADRPAAGYAFLMDAYLAMSPPNLTAALSASERHREYVNDWNADDLGLARYRHADILHKLDRHAEALRELELVETKVSAPLLAKVRFLQAICSEHEGLWFAAIGLWNELQDLAEHVPGGKGRVFYSRGLAQTHIEPVDDDMVVSLWAQAAAQNGDAAQAANIRLGHRLIVGNLFDAERAVKHWTAAFASVRVASDFKNPYIDVASTLSLFDEACDRLTHKQDFSRAHTLANLVTRITPAGVGEEKIGRVSMRWADHLASLAKAENVEATSSAARSRYQDAGDAFKQASLSRDAAGKVELFWLSARCYSAAKDDTNAAIVLEKFVALTTAADRRAEGHFALALAYQNQGQKGKSRDHFLKCIELNQPPFVYRALAKLADVEIESRKLDNAREILVQIITRNGPGLDREILEQSMYRLGKVLFDLGEPAEGAVRYREALAQFPNNPNCWAARQALADYACERAKQIAIPELQGLSPERRRLAEALWQNRTAYLEEAQEAYQSIANDLKARYEADKQLPMEQIVLWRNAVYAVGIVKRDLGNYGDALNYFRRFQLQYEKRPESLHAAKEILTCWQLLSGQPDEQAKYRETVITAVATALADLDKLPTDRDDINFHSGPIPFSREQWRDYLSRWQHALQHVTLRATTSGFAPRE